MEQYIAIENLDAFDYFLRLPASTNGDCAVLCTMMAV